MVIGKVCRIDGCTNILKKQDGQVCGAHRLRMHRHDSYEVSPDWKMLQKGKSCLTKFGYLRINVGGKRILEHSYVMEQNLGRELTQDERIHHINGVKTDNRIENLELLSNNSEHIHTYHNELWKTNSKWKEYSLDQITNIIEHISKPSKTYEICFCGKPVNTRNLCMTHYLWAAKHRLHKQYPK